MCKEKGRYFFLGVLPLSTTCPMHISLMRSSCLFAKRLAGEAAVLVDSALAKRCALRRVSVRYWRKIRAIQSQDCPTGGIRWEDTHV